MPFDSAPDPNPPEPPRRPRRNRVLRLEAELKEARVRVHKLTDAIEAIAMMRTKDECALAAEMRKVVMDAPAGLGPNRAGAPDPSADTLKPWRAASLSRLRWLC